MNIFLQIFLFVDVFIMGGVAALAARHGLLHYRGKGAAPTTPQVPMQTVHLPPAVREQLLVDAQANFQAVMARIATELQQDLEHTAEDIKKLLDTNGKQTVTEELQRYQARLSELQKQSEAEIGGMSRDLVAYQAQLKSKMNEEVTTEKQQLLAQIDTKLADAVASFLMESLGHNVDLGAQTAYLTGMLEEHKEELKKELDSEA